jgi:hypothetical protein
MMGEQKSGTAWRQTEALLQESHSLFELMTENKALYLEEIIKKYYVPFIKKQLSNKDEVVATLSDYGIKEIEKRFIKNRAIEMSIAKNLENLADFSKPFEPTTPDQVAPELQSQMQQTGVQRFIKPDEIGQKTWADILKDIEWDLEIDISGEQRDMQSVMTTLNTLYMALVQDPTKAEAARLVLSKILENTGVVSPVEIQSLETSQQQPQQPMLSPVSPQQPSPIGGS